MDAKSTRQADEDAAMEWVCATDKFGLDQWLAASASNRVAYLRAQMVWREIERLKSVSAGLPKGEVPARGVIEQSAFFTARREESIVRHRAHSRVRKYFLAAAVTLAVGLTFAVYQFGLFKSGTTHSTSVGGLATVPMADGSVLMLNTNTEVNISMTSHERSVDLKQGEAYFEVSPDASRPFTVKVGAQRVVVVGTRFSVRRDADHLRVMVAEGRVRIEEHRLLGEARGAEMVSAGMLAEVDDDHIKLSQQRSREIEQALRWREGYVVFDGMPLRAAVAEMNRYNARKLVVGERALEDIPVEGNFRTQNLDGFVRLLKYGFGIDPALTSDGNIVLKKKLADH